jgi:hypothetical protein
VQEVVQVNFPIKFSERALGQVGAGQLSSHPLLQELIVHVERKVARGFLLLQQVSTGLAERLFAALTTRRALLSERLGKKTRQE